MNSLPAFIPVLEELINRYLRLEPEAIAELGGLRGKEIAVEARDLELGLVLCIAEDGIHFTTRMDASPDAVVSGAPLTLMRMLVSEDASPLVSAGDIAITGDEELVERVRSLVRRVDVDWEEQLGGYLGEPLARRLGNIARDARRWRRRGGKTLAEDLRIFLVEELRLVPNQEEVAEYNSATDRLSEDVDRLERRIQRLVRELK